MTSVWPADVDPVPAEDWTRADVDSLALNYDTVENHGWYRNLEPTVEDLAAYLRPGHRVIDYSGGTGILIGRLLERLPALDAGYLLVDSSPKFLRLALEKLRRDPRVAFRLIRFLRDQKRLELLDEILPPSLRGGFDAVVSTNAVHLYYDLGDTLASWFRALRPGGKAFVQSGNIANPDAARGDWIIDATVAEIDKVARVLVAERADYAPFRPALDDGARLAQYGTLRDKFFLPVRPLGFYVDHLAGAGFVVDQVSTRSIQAEVDDWYQFLAAYHEGVLGWAGGSKRVDGADPDAETIGLRLRLIRDSLGRIFGGRATFQASWTYLTCRRP